MSIERIQVKTFKFKRFTRVNHLQKRLIEIECVDCGRVKEVRKDKFLMGNISDCICHQFTIENVKGMVIQNYEILDECVKNNRPGFKVKCVLCDRLYEFERYKLEKNNRLPICICERYKDAKKDTHNCDSEIGKYIPDKHLYVYQKVRMPSGRIGLRLLCSSCGSYFDVDASNYVQGTYGYCECDERYKHNKPEGALRKYRSYIGLKINNFFIKDVVKEGQYYKFICDCGCGAKDVLVFAHRLIKGDIFSCSNCNKSFGESVIENYLLENDISFKSQISFNDLLGKRNVPYRFDFGVYDKNNKLIALIEFDGKQHEDVKSIRYRNKDKSDEEIDLILEEYKYRDNRKNEYCKKNNIPLLRIKYIRSKNKIENQVYQFLSFLGGI